MHEHPTWPNLLAAARRALDTLREYHGDYLDRCTTTLSDGSVLVSPSEDDIEHLKAIEDVINDLDAAINRPG